MWSLDNHAVQLIETVAFAFSIMGIVASVSATFSFPLAAGSAFFGSKAWECPNIPRLDRWSRWNGLGVAGALPVRFVHSGVSCRNDFRDAVSGPRIRYFDIRTPQKDKRWALLLLCQVGTAKVRPVS